MTKLTNSEINQICEVLIRRSNELASFEEDLRKAFARLTSERSLCFSLPGSVDLAISREISRLRYLDKKLLNLKTEEEE